MQLPSSLYHVYEPTSWFYVYVLVLNPIGPWSGETGNATIRYFGPKFLKSEMRGGVDSPNLP